MVISPFETRQLGLTHRRRNGDFFLCFPGAFPQSTQIHLENIAIGELLNLSDFFWRKLPSLDVGPLVGAHDGLLHPNYWNNLKAAARLQGAAASDLLFSQVFFPYAL